MSLASMAREIADVGISGVHERMQQLPRLVHRCVVAEVAEIEGSSVRVRISENHVLDESDLKRRRVKMASPFGLASRLVSRPDLLAGVGVAQALIDQVDDRRLLFRQTLRSVLSLRA